MKQHGTCHFQYGAVVTFRDTVVLWCVASGGGDSCSLMSEELK